MSWKTKVRNYVANLSYITGAMNLLPATLGQHWRILMYHRIVDPSTLGYPVEAGMYVTPETFREHLVYLQRHCNVIPLKDLMLGLENRKPIKPRSVVLTFDDGWLDNYSNAYPLLKEFDIPASIFLATKYIGSELYYWSEEVAELLVAFNRKLALNSESIEDLLRAAALPRDVATLLKTTASTTPPVDLLYTLLKLLKGKGRQDRAQIIAGIRGVVGHSITPRIDFMNWDQVREMYKSKIISFGSHSHTHEYSTELDSREFREDIKQSQDLLSSNGIDHLPVFCYPGGELNDQTQRVLSPMRYSYALTVERKSNFSDRPKLLGRIGIHNDITHTPALFALRLWTGS